MMVLARNIIAAEKFRADIELMCLSAWDMDSSLELYDGRLAGSVVIQA
jgi:hypothetical protein